MRIGEGVLPLKYSPIWVVADSVTSSMLASFNLIQREKNCWFQTFFLYIP
jgi:hypothetical protein